MAQWLARGLATGEVLVSNPDKGDDLDDLECCHIDQIRLNFYDPPASEASREIANLTERKNAPPPYMVSKTLSVCLSVCL